MTYSYARTFCLMRSTHERYNNDAMGAMNAWVRKMAVKSRHMENHRRAP